MQPRLLEHAGAALARYQHSCGVSLERHTVVTMDSQFWNLKSSFLKKFVHLQRENLYVRGIKINSGTFYPANHQAHATKISNSLALLPVRRLKAILFQIAPLGNLLDALPHLLLELVRCLGIRRVLCVVALAIAHDK